jgi:hypothetical protein
MWYADRWSVVHVNVGFQRCHLDGYAEVDIEHADTFSRKKSGAAHQDKDRRPEAVDMIALSDARCAQDHWCWASLADAQCMRICRCYPAIVYVGAIAERAHGPKLPHGIWILPS